MLAKNIILLIVLSVFAIYFQTQLMDILRFLMYVHAELAKGLGVIFTINAVGEVVQSVIALLLIPAVIAVLFAVAHFFIRQHHFTHTLMMVWVCWAIMLAAILSQTGRVTDHPTVHGKPIPNAAQSNPAANGAPGQPGAPKVDANGKPIPAAPEAGKPGAPSTAPNAAPQNAAPNAAPNAQPAAPEEKKHFW